MRMHIPESARRFKLALLDRRLTQRDLSHCVHIDYTRLHRLVYGDASPTARERADISRILGVAADELFPDPAAAVPAP